GNSGVWRKTCLGLSQTGGPPPPAGSPPAIREPPRPNDLLRAAVGDVAQSVNRGRLFSGRAHKRPHWLTAGASARGRRAPRSDTDRDSNRSRPSDGPPLSKPRKPFRSSPFPKATSEISFPRCARVVTRRVTTGEPFQAAAERAANGVNGRRRRCMPPASFYF